MIRGRREEVRQEGGLCLRDLHLDICACARARVEEGLFAVDLSRRLGGGVGGRGCGRPAAGA